MRRDAHVEKQPCWLVYHRQGPQTLTLPRAGQSAPIAHEREWISIDDQHAQFIIAVADLCAAAAMAELEVEVITGDGARVRGLTAPVPAASGAGEVDESGYARSFAIDDRILLLADVVGCTIWRRRS